MAGSDRFDLCCRRGVVLPAALLLVLALGALSTAVLVLSRTELLLERGDLVYLRSRIDAEEALASRSGELDAGLPVDGAVDQVGLGAGFVLVRARTAGDRPAPSAVYWILDPDSVAARLPGAVEVGGEPPEGGVQGPGTACPPGAGRPLIQVRPPDPDPWPDPPLPEAPRVGILGMQQLLELPAIDLPSPGVLPADSREGIFRAIAGGQITGGEGTGLLLAPGDLTLSAETRFRGLVLVRGDLDLAGTARVEGVVLAGGTVRVAGEALILGCAGFAARALAHPSLGRSHPVPGGTLLGRN